MKLTVDQALQQGVSAHQAGKLREAEQFYRAILAKNPQHPDANHNLGVLAVNVGKVNDSLPFFKQAIEVDPQQSQFWHSYVGALIKQGKLDYAREILDQARGIGIKGDSLDRLETELDRLETSNIETVSSSKDGNEQQIDKLIDLFTKGKLEDAHSYGNTLLRKGPTSHVISNILGAVCAALDKNEEAMENFNRAIELKPDYSEAHNNLGNFLKKLGQNSEALQFYNRAIEINPYSPAACFNRGLVLGELHKFHEAVDSYNRAIELKPDYADAHNNLGNTLNQLCRYEEAIENFDRAIELKPDYADAYNNRGNTFHHLRRYEEAIENFNIAIGLRRGYATAYNNLAITLCCVRAKVFSNSLAENFLDVLAKENIVRPAKILPAIVTLLKHHGTIQDAVKFIENSRLNCSISGLCIGLSQIPLFIKTLEICPIPDLEIEKMLTGLRRYLLLDGRELLTNQYILHFQCALAHQCFINEFIYEETEEETVAIKSLEENIQKSFLDGKEIQPQDVACLASFRPLSSYLWVDSLAHLSELSLLLRRQVREVKQELYLKNSIPQLGPFRDKTSLAVQTQYENNPYPRWVKTKLEMERTTLPGWIEKTNLRVMNEINSLSKKPRILIAGCGTGEHVLTTASRFENSHITAIDLSLSSLGYAKRKSEDLGLTNIDYLRADILNIGLLDCQFDIIESVGVLHHMLDPVAGWEVLTDYLKRHGLMKIGLYSELGRQHISSMRNKRLVENMSLSKREIIKIRCQIINSGDFNLNVLKDIPDFYSTSMFRDLLFHVKEHRFTIPQISEAIEKLGLAFLGFEFSDNFLKTEFENLNPEKEALYDLKKWHEFEKSNPSAFSGMYQFWVQKI